MPNILSFSSRVRVVLGLLPVAIVSDPTHIKFYRKKEILKAKYKRSTSKPRKPKTGQAPRLQKKTPIEKKMMLTITIRFLKFFFDKLLYGRTVISRILLVIRLYRIFF